MLERLLVQHSHFNPNRRNRNIGTSKAGHGQNNRLVIPSAWADSRMFYEKLVNPVEVSVIVHSLELAILVEPTLPGYIHSCTVDDIVRMIGMIPTVHFENIKLVVLRQPRRKENILSSCWGRLVYWSEIGRHSGPTIFLEAQNLGRPLRRAASLQPDEALELERLRDDGHRIVFDKRRHQIMSSPDSVRNTQLYRTFPHEVGHYVDYLESVEIPARDCDEREKLSDRYWTKTSHDKEAFAHRYADEFRSSKRAEGLIPFDRIIDEENMKRQGLDPTWFTVAEA